MPWRHRLGLEQTTNGKEAKSVVFEIGIDPLDELATPVDFLAVWRGHPTPPLLHALADPAVRQRLADLGQEIVPREQQTLEALGAFQKSEVEKWWPIIKAANMKAE